MLCFALLCFALLVTVRRTLSYNRLPPSFACSLKLRPYSTDVDFLGLMLSSQASIG